MASLLLFDVDDNLTIHHIDNVIWVFFVKNHRQLFAFREEFRIVANNKEWRENGMQRNNDRGYLDERLFFKHKVVGAKKLYEIFFNEFKNVKNMFKKLKKLFF